MTQSDPTATQTFSSLGATSFTVQYWDGSAWQTISGGSVTGNSLVWKKLTFTAVNTSKIRVTVNAASDIVARIAEVEAWAPAIAAPTANINWLVTDQLGTPRIIFDQSGSLATTKRHDYLPFGEEIYNGARTSAMGYAANETTRQKFTSKERDSETGLNYFLARYYSSTQGRFTGADPILIMKQKLWDPQQWNMYAYTRNSPLRYIDPSGKYICRDNGKCESDDDKAFEAARQRDLNSKDKKVREAAGAYGDPNIDNKVYVGFSEKPNSVNFGLGKDGKYDGTLEVNISREAMTPGDPAKPFANTGTDAAVAHEGEHVRQRKAIIAGRYDPRNEGTNISRRQAERYAYDVGFRVIEAQGGYYYKWSSPEEIDKHLAEDPLYKNTDLNSPIIDTSKIPSAKAAQTP